MTDKQANIMIKCLKELIEKVDALSSKAAPDRNVDVREMCDMLNMKKTAVYERISQGLIPAYKINGRYMIPLSKLQQIMPDIR